MKYSLMNWITTVNLFYSLVTTGSNLIKDLIKDKQHSSALKTNYKVITCHD